jgi:hypothetical protein
MAIHAKQVGLLVLFFAGINMSFIAWGVFQEKVTSTEYQSVRYRTNQGGVE